MAALLKKRALAEFSQVLQEEPPKPLKKLCISKKPAPQKTIDVAEVLKSGSSTDVIMMLIQLTEAVPTQVTVTHQSFGTCRTGRAYAI
ncbi:unnamed protein product, partial [Ixodes pacificus]